MSRTGVMLVTWLASYAAINLVLSAMVALVWRHITERSTTPAAVRARRLGWLRALPSLGAALLTAGVVAPAFAIYEPHHESEAVGPLALSLAVMALLQIAGALYVALTTLIRTRAAERAWLQAATALDLDPPLGVPAYAVDSPEPIVALVGVFQPKLIAARRVVDSCTPDELVAIVAHERGHLHARDNFLRWLMASAPDTLRWTPAHRQIETAWHDAAEDAADDAATGRNSQSRLDLAALIVKVARMTTTPSLPAAAVNPFADKAGLDRRVRRLLDSPPEGSSRAGIWPVVLTVAVAVVAADASMDLRDVYELAEAVIAFGR